MGPFTDWDGFLFHYAHVRAGLSSLLKNPDTKDDPDLIALCDLWRAQRFGSIDTNQLEELYNALNQKPVFRNNSIFVDLYGAFVKSVYELFYGEYYTQHFFDIDE